MLHCAVAHCACPPRSHVDKWDSLVDNEYLSAEGVADLVRQLASLQRTPPLETPPYTVLQRRAAYEVRRYAPFLVAQVALPQRAGGPPAGFGTLARYIFGANDKGTKMEMTTPVLTRMPAAGGVPGGMSMAFPMERKWGDDAAALPAPQDASVGRAAVPGAVRTAATFAGIATETVRCRMRICARAACADSREARSCC